MDKNNNLDLESLVKIAKGVAIEQAEARKVAQAKHMDAIYQEAKTLLASQIMEGHIENGHVHIRTQKIYENQNDSMSYCGWNENIRIRFRDEGKDVARRFTEEDGIPCEYRCSTGMDPYFSFNFNPSENP